jgi:hypothetical protein
LSVAEQPLLASRLRAGALAAVRERTWDAALERLADGYRRTPAAGAAAAAAARRTAA